MYYKIICDIVDPSKLTSSISILLTRAIKLLTKFDSQAKFIEYALKLVTNAIDIEIKTNKITKEVPNFIINIQKYFFLSLKIEKDVGYTQNISLHTRKSY